MGLISESRNCRYWFVPEKNGPPTFRIKAEVVHGVEQTGTLSIPGPELFSMTGANCLTVNAGAIILSMWNNGEYWKPRTPKSYRSVSDWVRLMGYGARYIFGSGKEIIR